ncbi:hypothetical protein FQN54_006052 [Arachnomyces sp. PD_36]|nr:hypothetical protein FQN54_006052 [Arachnomyces sp. PD_36]
MSHYEEEFGRAKRRKIEDDSAASTQPVAITSAKQLKWLLVFQQSTSSEVKDGFIQFKEFLNSIPQTESEGEKSKKFQILKEYCDSQYREGNEPGETTCFSEIIQTWTFAEGRNNESLLSTIPSVLALFLKTVSSRLEFRDFGVAFCRFMVMKEQLRLLNLGLTAGKSKEHMISPCIRLLTEIVSFDGGAVAQAVYAKRDITFKRFDAFLVARKVSPEQEEKDRGKPTLRRIAQRYVLANFKFQNAAAKDDIISQGKVIRAFLEDIRRDSRDIVVDIIRTMDKHIVSDSTLTRHVKSRFLNRWNLERLVTLYGFEKGAGGEGEKSEVSVPDEIHKFLMKVCTDPERGVLLSETGWYPTGSNPDSLLADGEGTIDLGLDSPAYFDRYQQSVPVRNGNLSTLTHVLRPESDILQMQLLLEIFKAAPELVAEYFSRHTMFAADPKPSPSWLGESALLFSTVQLDVPENLGWKSGLPAMPPPVSVVIESILPRPLTQKILTRCLNQNTDVVTLFAIRIETIAFRKLQKVLKIFNTDRGAGQSLWNQAATNLLAEFSRRCPSMKDVVSLFRQTAKDNLQQQEALAELLSLYYEVVPTVAFEEKFDVSLTLVEVLRRLDVENSAEDAETLLSLLQHILVIARQSPSMRWWQKPESLGFSAFTSVLKALVGASGDSSSKQIQSLLRGVLVENTVLLPQPSSFGSLIASLKASDTDELQAQLSFFDNCVTRLVKKPVMYQEIAGTHLSGEKKGLSPIMATVNEQWPFVVKKGDADAELAVAGWIARLLGYLKQAGEDKDALAAIRDKMLEATDKKSSRSVLKKALKFTREDVEIDDIDETADDSPSDKKQSRRKGPKSKPQLPDLSEVFGTPPKEDTSHHALNRWERDDIEVALERGYAGNLMRCLCSEHQEIRIQASQGISRFMAKLKESTYTEWQAIYVLSGEVLETVKEFGVQEPFPSVAGELAARSIIVLNNPLHKIYGKVNKFLNKGPVWEIGKIPSYWVDKILLHEPEYDDSHIEEVEWLLDLLIHGLRSESDMEIYRRTNVFERFLALYHSPGLTKDLQKKILHLIVRASQIGGSTTLLTRVAAMSWLRSQAADSDSHESILRKLAKDMYDCCDQERVNKWSAGAMSKIVAGVVEVNV